jgi:hypothetical protein
VESESEHEEISSKPEETADFLQGTENINPWAVEYVENVYKLGLVDELINPLEYLKRKEAAVFIANLFEISKEFSSLDIKTVFTDIEDLNEEEIKAVKTVYTNSIMSGKSSGIFSPDSFLTRAEAAAIMAKISNRLFSGL